MHQASGAVPSGAAQSRADRAWIHICKNNVIKHQNTRYQALEHTCCQAPESIGDIASKTTRSTVLGAGFAGGADTYCDINYSSLSFPGGPSFAGIGLSHLRFITADVGMAAPEAVDEQSRLRESQAMMWYAIEDLNRYCCIMPESEYPQQSVGQCNEEAECIVCAAT